MKFVFIAALLVSCAFAHPMLDLLRGFGEAVLEPAGLDCAFAISVNSTQEVKYFDEQGEVVVEEISTIVQRAYYGFTELITTKNDTYYEVNLTRFDLKETVDGVPCVTRFAYSSDNDVCLKIMLPVKDARSGGDEFRSEMADKKTFENVTDSTFNGKPCKLYLTDRLDEGLYAAYYVDENKRILASNLTLLFGSFNTSAFGVFTYEEDPTPEAFKLLKSVASGCDEAAYTAPPKTLPCSLDSSSSSSSSAASVSSTRISSSSSAKPASSTSQSPATSTVVSFSLLLLALFVALF